MKQNSQRQSGVIQGAFAQMYSTPCNHSKPSRNPCPCMSLHIIPIPPIPSHIYTPAPTKLNQTPSLRPLCPLGRSLHPLLPPNRIQRPHPRQLLINILLLQRDLMRLFGGRPEAGDVEPVVEVRAEVVHPADGEEDVHSELPEAGG